MLERWRCTVIAADTAADAAAQVSDGGRIPDFILADLRLRGSNTGVQAIEALREAVGAPVPGLIVTGDTDPGRLRHVAASGYTLLHKPLSTAKFRMAIEVMLAERAADVSRDAVL
jgi:CheY-like chemotaxis protein